MSWGGLFGEFLLFKLEMVIVSNKSVFKGYLFLRFYLNFEFYFFYSEEKLLGFSSELKKKEMLVVEFAFFNIGLYMFFLIRFYF